MLARTHDWGISMPVLAYLTKVVKMLRDSMEGEAKLLVQQFSLTNPEALRAL
jgi:hypothetical protein